MPTGPVLHDITDTARWVAVYRALESDRPDAVFHDPHAWRLAGDRGKAIAKGLGGSAVMAVAMAVRTRVIDEVILDAIAHDGVDVVLNLAAGLDSRPYRLALPSDLTWVEVDLPPMIAYKTEVLAEDRPACRLERVALDLADRAGRQALFARVTAMGARILVLTEGLLVYLTPDMVGALADDLHAMPQAVRWVSDVIGPDIVARRRRRRWARHMDAANLSMQFAPDRPSAFFGEHGWQTHAYRSSMEEGRRLRREFPGARLWRWLRWLAPAEQRERLRWMSGIIVLAPDRQPAG